MTIVVDPSDVFDTCARVMTYTGTRAINAVRTSMLDGIGIQFGCVCTIATVFSGNAPIHLPVFGSPASGQGTLEIVPRASRTRNAACSKLVNPKRASSMRCQKMRSAVGSAARSLRSTTGDSHATTSSATAPANITATTARDRIVPSSSRCVLRRNAGARYRTAVSDFEQFRRVASNVLSHPGERKRRAVGERRRDIFHRLVTARRVHLFSAEHRHQLDGSESGRARFLFATAEDVASDSAPRMRRHHEHRAHSCRLGRRIEQPILATLRCTSRVQLAAAAPSAAADNRLTIEDDEVGSVGDEVSVDVRDVLERAGDLLRVVGARTKSGKRFAHHALDRGDIIHRGFADRICHEKGAGTGNPVAPDANRIMNRSAVQTLTLPNGSHVQDFRRGSIFFIGSATVLIRYAGFTILTDPNFVRRGERVNVGFGERSERLTDPAITLEDLPLVDVVVLSHLHGDHFDRVVAAKLDRRTPIVTNKDAAGALKRLGFGRAFALQTWEPFEVFKGDAHLRITAMPAVHGGGLLGFFDPAVMGSMMEFSNGEKVPLRIYATGDTLAHPCLAEIPRRYLNIDVALLHLGEVTDAEAIRLLGPHMTIPVHFNDYAFFNAPLDTFKRAVREAGLDQRVRYLAHGETFDIRVPDARL